METRSSKFGEAGTMKMIVPLAILVFALPVWNESASGQKVNVAELTTCFQGQKTLRKNLFLGLGASTIEKRSLDGKVNQQIEREGDFLEEDVWRIDTFLKAGDQKGGAIIIARDSRFSFQAIRKFNGTSQLHEHGFDSTFHDLLRNRWSSGFGFAVAPSDLAGNEVADFLAAPGLVATRLSGLPEHEGHLVEGIRFNTVAGTWRGEIHWLPDDAMLLTRLIVEVEIAPGDVRNIRDTTIEYRDYNDRFLPWRISKEHHNGRTNIMEVMKFRSANPDRSHYTAESLGIVTPQAPVKDNQR